MKVKRFYEYELIKEEFVGGLIKGALGKLFNLFSQPFKDLSNDFKKLFKPNDIGSIKDIILTNFNQAIDSAQKELPKITEEGALTDLMPKMIDQLVQLSQNIGKDVVTGLGKTDDSEKITKVVKAILLGDKNSKWSGLVGALDPNNETALKYNGGIKINYKFNKTEYDKTLTEAGTKGGGNVLKAKKDAAMKFLDSLQKDVVGYIEKELTDEELNKISGMGEGEMSYDKLKELFDKKTPVLYLLKGKTKKDYDPKKTPDEQKDIVGLKTINSIDDKGVVFLDKDGKPTIKKSYREIIGPVEVGENAMKAKEVLGKIKGDEEKMSKVVKWAEFIQNDANKDKVAEIEKMIGGGE